MTSTCSVGLWAHCSLIQICPGQAIALHSRFYLLLTYFYLQFIFFSRFLCVFPPHSSPKDSIYGSIKTSHTLNSRHTTQPFISNLGNLMLQSFLLTEMMMVIRMIFMMIMTNTANTNVENILILPGFNWLVIDYVQDFAKN